jgi:ubiquinone/menaquinone biosynthesis C-methylase UbiE
MEAVNEKSQMEKIRNYEKGFMAVHLINLGDKLEIFRALNENKNGLTVRSMADMLGLHEPYLRVWCQSAYHFEILDADDQGLFRLQPFLNEILADKSHFRNYLANISVDADLIGPGFLQCVQSFRNASRLEMFSSAEISEKAYNTTKNIPLAFIFMIFPKHEQLKQKLESGIRFLDVGCGNGSFMIQLAQTFTNSTFVGIGPDAYGIQSARKSIGELKMEERVSVGHMGAENLTYDNEFDMASMVVTLHEIQPTVREDAIKRVYNAIKKGGHLLVLDFPYPRKLEDFRNPLYNYGILDQLYEMCAGTMHLDNDQQNEMLARAGFKNIQRMPIGKGMFDFILAEK